MAKKTASESGSFTDTRRVKELVALMADNGLTEIELVEDKSRIVLRRGTVSSGAGVAPVGHAPLMAHAPVMQAAQGGGGGAGGAGNAPTAPAASEDAGLVAIKSPMVGTFYSAPNPESDAYVSIGAAVQKDKTVVCIIEAMKVFNEIHADITGSVVKILVSNGQTVEFGQPLFMVKPA